MENLYKNDISSLSNKNLKSYSLLKFIIFYLVLIILFFYMGTALFDKFNCVITADFCSKIIKKYFIFDKSPSTIHFIWSIIYNSVDIFKIMIIIILSGFTMISGIILKITTVSYSIYAGFSCAASLKYITECDLSNHLMKSLKAIVISVFLLYLLIFLGQCIKAHELSSKISKYTSTHELCVSNDFWKYIGTAFFSFGYIIIVYTTLRILLQILY